MSAFRRFIEEIQIKLDEAWKRGDRHEVPMVSFAVAVDRNWLVDEFTSLVGRELIDRFFQGSSFGIGSVLQSNASFELEPDGRLRLAAEQYEQFLESLSRQIRQGKMSYVVTIHLANIDIEGEFHLNESTALRVVTPEYVADEYPVNEAFFAVNAYTKEHWCKHCVELVYFGNGRVKDFQQLLRIEDTFAFINRIVDSFRLADIQEGDLIPVATHINLHSHVENRYTYLSSSIQFEPTRVSLQSLKSVRTSYRMLGETSQDSVLQTAIDRFLLGSKQDLHHPNRVNTPHWDKVVDYVIALETLFLTINGGPSESELSYRFKLNGAMLLSQVYETHPSKFFKALGDLYGLRSKVVHGEAEPAQLKLANRFITTLNIDDPSRQHPMGRLGLISGTVERWLKDTISLLASCPPHARPYNLQGGWEQLIWSVKTDTIVGSDYY